MSKKKVISKKIDTESIYDILDQKTPNEVIEYMMHLRDIIHRGKKISFDIEPYGYDGGVNIQVYELREETDKEYKSRMLIEQKAREKKKLESEKRLEKDRKEYERLKKVFE